jgi:CDP-6-deoxy-D-xylo-4-hexulose-3-dehydrase
MSNWKLMENGITNMDRLKLAKFVLTTKKFTNGDQVRKFEKQWSEWLGCDHSLFVSSGSTANLLLISAIKEKYNLKNGDKVLVPACTWVTNVGPIIQLGLTPIFCDINFENFSFDVDDLKKIAEIHDDIKIIFVTHLLGFPADNEKYLEIFPQAIVLDDVCESHGAKFKDGSRVGSDSLGATFSFYFGHHMTTVEGGMVCTNDSELYDLMKMKRSHGMARESINFEDYAKKYSNIDKSFLFVTDGFNFRNHEICAVLGISQLKRLNDNIEKRKKNYEEFLKLMSNHEDKFYVPKNIEGNSNFCFPLISKNKDIYNRLKEKFIENDIEYRPVVSGNLLSHPFLRNYSLEYVKNQGSNVQILESMGLYVGNSQFVGKKNIEILKRILGDISENR